MTMALGYCNVPDAQACERGTEYTEGQQSVGTARFSNLVYNQYVTNSPIIILSYLC